MLINHPIEKFDLSTGQLAVTKLASVFNCYGLGSCVGVFIYDMRRKIAGAAHIMKPGEETYEEHNYEYAKPALTALLRQMKRDNPYVRLKAKITGGANVIGTDSFKIGERNVQQVIKILDEFGITVEALDSGGFFGRTARFHFPTNQLEIKTSQGKKYTI